MPLEITTKIGCTNMCEYCPQSLLIKKYARLNKKTEPSSEAKKKDKIMSLDTFIKCISTIPSSMDMHFTGYVEPFENPACADMMLHANSKGHTIACNTTLVGLTVDIIEKIRKIPFRAFRVHLPSSTYKEFIGVKRPLSTLETGQYALSEEWLKILTYISNNPLHNQSYHCHGGLHPQLEAPPGLVKTVAIESRASNLLKENPETPLPPDINPRGKCPRIYQNVLRPDGALALCCQDYGLTGLLGNLLEQTWQEYRNSEKFAEIVKHGHDLCDFCDKPLPPRDRKNMDDQVVWDEWRRGKK